jgi:hypothetical protein
MIKNKEFTNPKGGVRLDAALLALAPTATKSFVKNAIALGDVTVNGRPAFKGL